MNEGVGLRRRQRQFERIVNAPPGWEKITGVENPGPPTVLGAPGLG